MQVLKAAGVTVIGDLPFEDRTTQAGYLAALRVGFGQALSNQDTSSSGGFSETYRGDWYRSSIALHHQSRVLELEAEYEGFLTAQGITGTLGLAEKFIGFEVLRLMKAADTTSVIKPVFLVRDPRDTFISVKKFNEKRGFKSFNESGDDLSLLDSICNFSKTQVFEARKGNGILCYYEDFVNRRSQSVCDLFRYLGVMHPNHQFMQTFWGALGVDQSASKHMTSGSQNASMDRWKGEEFRHLHDLFRSRERVIFDIGYL
ncbi:hypothetical protein ACELLULO517_00880 [Acidisoma cellulosilytica]|uniref:Sulfotransferase domain-containing protein n=1 Tax=Acidisoma cellulosilyticum TaxID=2802395 RepID=A0A963YXK1_9PROT|nr:hypothetical protein [Acidisoma cellulosilyticum]MCB8878770.1 hypothetical protein [Acidisoma cellulosilyticum]